MWVLFYCNPGLVVMRAEDRDTVIFGAIIRQQDLVTKYVSPNWEEVPMQNLPSYQVHEHHLRRPSELRITARNCGRDQEEDFEFRIPKVLIIEAIMSTMAHCDLQNISGF